MNGEVIANLKLQDVIKRVKGPLGTPVTLTVLHVGGKVEDLTMNREDIVVRTIKGYRRSRRRQADGHRSVGLLGKQGAANRLRPHHPVHRPIRLTA